VGFQTGQVDVEIGFAAGCVCRGTRAPFAGPVFLEVTNPTGCLRSTGSRTSFAAAVLVGVGTSSVIRSTHDGFVDAVGDLGDPAGPRPCFRLISAISPTAAESLIRAGTVT